ncbi:MAG: gliding motility-associated-like protein [Candidatus Latescibacterota bacterium]|jgi:gliding motility-associated-like protein
MFYTYCSVGFFQNLKGIAFGNIIKSSLLTLLFLASAGLFAQGPGSLFVDAGADVIVPCDEGNGCVDITADFLRTFETASATYSVDAIDYAPPFPFDGLANSINITTDDTWSPVDNLPYDFCFFGNLETEFQVGSNGVVRFDVDPTDISNGWAFTEDLPNNSNPTLGEANVFSPVHDIYPGINPINEIGYEVLGTFPNRVLVVSYYEVAMFSCTTINATHMMVFYEFSNVIEIYIQDKPSCDTWNSGNAAIGIQNDNGDIAFVPPGRNTSDSPWTTTNEAWRFSPSGIETYAFEWLDASGAVIGTTPTINVCPPNGSATYTARVTYTNNCNGEVVVLTDDVFVEITNGFEVDLGDDQDVCDVASYDITAAITGGDPADATFLWSTGETTQTITVTTSDTYSVDVTLDGCTVTKSVDIILGFDPILDLPEEIMTCFDGDVFLDATPSNYDPSEVTFEWTQDGTVLGETGPVLTVNTGGTYGVTVAAGNCSTMASTEVIPRDDLVVELGDDYKTCANEPQTLTATTDEMDVVYQWQLNGDSIVGETTSSLNFMLDGSLMGTQTYTVIISVGDCTGSDSVDVELYDVGNCTISQGISPNGSIGFNDSLDLEFLSDRSGISKIQIFNRLGTSVFTKTNYVNEWSGQADEGADLPSGTYFYVIDFTNEDPLYGMQATGWIYVNQSAN